MRESIKIICALVLIVSCLIAGLAWFDPRRPDQTAWLVRVASTGLAALSLGTLLKLQFTPDIAPDFLHRVAGKYFNRGGFCFALAASSRDGICHFKAYFQNQWDRPYLGRIALRPGRRFYLGRAEIETIAFDIDSEPGAFGVARVPVPLEYDVQGT